MAGYVFDLISVVMMVALGGMLVSAIRRVRSGDIRPPKCPSCGRLTSRSYATCNACGSLLDRTSVPLGRERAE